MEKSRFVKSIAVFLLVLMFRPAVDAQEIITLNAPEGGNSEHKASQRVNFLNGYSTTSPYNMWAHIDATSKNTISPVSYGTLFNSSDLANRTINTSLAVGKTEGNYDITSTGAVAYNIPIELPPGTNGVTPRLAINYNSQTSKGILGVGWNIEGISKIYRTARNRYLDAATGTVAMSNNDVFELDGNRLIVLNGQYGAAGATYGTERETFYQITSNGSQGNGPDWFKVETKEGVTMEYGKTNDAEYVPVGQSSVASWMLNKVYDQYGNFYTYEYRYENGEVLLHKITYQATEVVFDYSTRDDINTYYFGGYPFTEGHLVSSIKILTNNRVVRTYQFFYGKDLYSYLTEVKEFGSDNSELNSTIFDYGTEVSGFSEEAVLRSELTPSNGNSSGKVVWPGDYNGDGKTDLVSLNYDYIPSSGLTPILIGAEKNEDLHYSRDNYGNVVPPSSSNNYIVWIDWSLFINQGNNSFLETSSGNGFPQGFEAFDELNLKNTSVYGNSFIQNLDFNGDGLEDIIFTVHEDDGTNDLYRFTIYLSNGTGFTAQPSFTETVTRPTGTNEHIIFTLRYLDADGDGKKDILTHKFPFKYNSGSSETAISGNLPSLSIRFGGDDSNPKNITNTPVSFDYKFTHGSTQKGIFPLDINGNGRAELVDIYDHVNDSYVTLELDENDQVTFSTQTEHYCGARDVKERYFGDFNNDGKSDYIEQQPIFSYNNPDWHYESSTGNGFTQDNLGAIFQHPGNYNMQITHFSIDINGDGRTDIVEVEGAGYSTPMIHVFLNNGAGFEKSSYQLSYPFDPKSFNEELDFGDFNGDGQIDLLVDRGLSQGIYIYYFQKEETQGLLHGVSDGYANHTSFSYEYLTKPSIYSKNSNASYPLVDVQPSIPVVKTVQSPNGIGGTSTTDFTYEGAKVHYEGKGFLGFDKVISVNTTTDRKKTTTYETDPTFYIHNPVEELVEVNSTQEQLSKIELTYTYRDLGNKRVFPFISQKVSTDLLSNFAITLDYTYDNYGNITNSTANRGGIETETIANTYQQFGSWIPSSLMSTSITKTRQGATSSYTRTTTYQYNSQGSPIQKIEDPGDSKALTTSYTYNTMGNQTGITLSGSGVPTLVSSYKYDNYGRFVIETTDVQGLKSYATFDEKWGVMLSETDHRGLIAKYEYDGFGRIIKKKGFENISSVYGYAWDVGTGGGTGTTTVNNSVYYTFEAMEGSPTKKVWFDSQNRERKREIDGFNQKIHVVTSYDAKGNIKTKSAPFYPGASNIVVTTNTYNTHNKLVSSSTPAGTRSFSYSYNQGETSTQITSPGLAPKSKTVDGTGKLVSASDNGGSLTYTYYASGLQKEIKLGGSTIASMQYDLQGNQTQLNDINAGISTYTYDAYGNLTSQTDAKGLTTLSYNNFNQVINRVDPLGTINYEYYTNGGGVNQVKSVLHSNGSSEKYLYDKYGRNRSYSKTIEGETFTFINTFDRYSRPLARKYPSGFEISYEYNSNGYLKKISDFSNNTPIWEGTAMNAFGKYTDVTRAYAQNTTYLYNEYGMLEEVNGALDMDFNFDPATGNLLDRKDNNHNGIFEDFEYDNLDRLIKMSRNGVQDQVVDFKNNGNISRKDQITQYVYSSSKPNAVKSVEDHSNLISDNEQNITYNALHQPALIDEGDFELELSYGANGQRVLSKLREGGSLKRLRYYLPEYEKQVFSQTGKEQLIHYITAGDGLAAMYVIENGVGTMYFTYTDYLGSILKVTDVSGTTVAEQSFDAWGRRRNVSDWTYSTIAGTPDWLYRGYTGHEHYDEFALINMNGRMYDPLLGRMLSVDNYVQDNTGTQGFNRYSYVMNNPLKYTDPNGEFLGLAIAIGAIIGAYIGGAASNGWEFNPTKWDWKSGDTWVGLLTGAVIGAAAGYGFYVAAPIVANTAFFAHFGVSGTIAAYGLVGGVAGGLTGYGAGFVGGLLHSNWDLEYARKSGELGAQIGAAAGSFLGGIAGFAEGYKPQKPIPPIVLPSSQPQYGGGALTASNNDFVSLAPGNQDEMFHIGTTPYVYDGHMKVDPIPLKFYGGQKVRVVIKNTNILGASIYIQDQSRYHYVKSFFGQRKVYSGNRIPFIILPGQSKSFEFTRFGYTPMGWLIEVGVQGSDAAMLRISVYSNWEPGQPYDNPYFNNSRK